MDIIADGLTKLRNAQKAKYEKVIIRGSSVLKRICHILKERGYIVDFAEKKDQRPNDIELTLKYDEKGRPVIKELVRISKSSRRVYSEARKIPRVANGFATVIVSTSRGVLTGKQAQEQNVGGEVLCYVF